MAQPVLSEDEFPSVTLPLEMWAGIKEGIDEAITFYSHRKVADFERVRLLTEARDEIMAQTGLPGDHT